MPSTRRDDASRTTDARAPAPASSAPGPGAAAGPEPLNILLVDDREENLLALEAILEPLGQTLVRARSGEEALRKLLQQEFALVLLDVQMPGMDGLETARLMRERRRATPTPIIFITADAGGAAHALSA